jgi:hypothetical protein
MEWEDVDDGSGALLHGGGSGGSGQLQVTLC